MAGAEAAEAQVAVRNLAGQLMGELEVDARTTGHKLKNMIAARWQLPPDCQELLLGATVLDDRGAILRNSHVNCSEALEVTLVLTLEKVYRRCEDPSAKVRQRAVQALGNAALKGDTRAITMVSERLEDSSAIVKGAAVKAFSRVADRGDDCAVTAATARLTNADADVRRAAVEALAQVALVGDEGSIEALRRCLDDPNAHVRLATAEALAQLGDSDAPRPAALPSMVFKGPDAQADGPSCNEKQSKEASAACSRPASQKDTRTTVTTSTVKDNHRTPDQHEAPASKGPKRDTVQLDAADPLGPLLKGGQVRHEGAVERTCPKGHALKRSIIEDAEDDEAEFECDGCDAVLPCGSIIFGCRRCDFDLCQRCARTKGPAAI